MRKIKFRAWDKKLNRFASTLQCYDRLNIGLDGSLRIYGMNTEDEEDWDARFLLMQYTGLKDKNGKEIYEGDILLERDGTYIRRLQVCFGMFWHVTGDSRDGVDDEGGEAVGFYLKNYYGTNTYPENKGCALCPNHSDYLEIGGNIYENPELLKEKADD